MIKNIFTRLAMSAAKSSSTRMITQMVRTISVLPTRRITHAPEAQIPKTNMTSTHLTTSWLNSAAGYFSGQIGLFYKTNPNRNVVRFIPDQDYYGPSVRYVSFNTMEEVNKYIESGGLTNNSRGEKHATFSVYQYVKFNKKGPFFGGCVSLADLKVYIQNVQAKDGFIILMCSLAKSDGLKKAFANVMYSQETSEVSPHQKENEILHFGGNFADLVVGVIRFQDMQAAIDGKDVENMLQPGTKIHVAEWHKAEMYKACRVMDEITGVAKPEQQDELAETVEQKTQMRL